MLLLVLPVVKHTPDLSQVSFSSWNYSARLAPVTLKLGKHTVWVCLSTKADVCGPNHTDAGSY